MLKSVLKEQDMSSIRVAQDRPQLTGYSEDGNKHSICLSYGEIHD